MENLNLINIDSSDEPYLIRQEDYSVDSCDIRVLFKNLEDNLCNLILEADAVFGCVAWMTSEKILSALSKTNASIIVQKEDLWRPDLDTSRYPGWKQKLLDKYMLIKTSCERLELHPPANRLSFSTDPAIDGVRCVGLFNREKKPASPRMHHKFLVFAKRSGSFNKHGVGNPPVPYAVWTGSFNFTHNSSQSFENAVYITNSVVADAYFLEYQQILAFSEPLDWTEDWCAPEWRIGT